VAGPGTVLGVASAVLKVPEPYTLRSNGGEVELMVISDDRLLHNFSELRSALVKRWNEMML
jgi:hypothetical protein